LALPESGAYMVNPLLSPVMRFLGRLRYPTLFKLALLLMTVSWLVPDPLPFVDEILTAVLALLLANWRKKETPKSLPEQE